MSALHSLLLPLRPSRFTEPLLCCSEIGSCLYTCFTLATVRNGRLSLPDSYTKHATKPRQQHMCRLRLTIKVDRNFNLETGGSFGVYFSPQPPFPPRFFYLPLFQISAAGESKSITLSTGSLTVPPNKKVVQLLLLSLRSGFPDESERERESESVCVCVCVCECECVNRRVDLSRPSFHVLAVWKCYHSSVLFTLVATLIIFILVSPYLSCLSRRSLPVVV